MYISSLCLSLLLIVGDGGFVYAGQAHDTTAVTINTATTDPLQILFEIGVMELEKGHYASAADIFESLAKKTKSPRVQLELARALFLDHRYKAAKKVFSDVLRQPGIPWTVQENIHAYIEQIDSALGYLKLGLSVVSDSNPRNFTDSRQIVIAGQPLNIVPPEDNKEVYGLRYSVSAAKAFTETASLAGYLDTSFSDFSNSMFDRWGADFGLLVSPRSLPKLKYRVGLEESYYAKEHLYEFPYIGIRYTPQPLYQFRLNNEFKVGRLGVPNAGYLDATNLSLTTNVARQASSKIYTSGDLYLEKSITEEDAYSYYGGALGLSFSFDFLQSLRVKPFTSLGKRLYEDDDPFWGETRNDTRLMVGITLTKINLDIFGYTPEVGVSYEENKSNIEYYSYSKFGVILKFDEVLPL